MTGDEHERIIIVNYSGNDVFAALYGGLSGLRGFKIIKADKILKKIELKAGAGIFSRGETISVSVAEMPDKTTEVTVSFMPKMGTLFGGFTNMEKCQANMNAIFASLSAELKNFSEIVPDIGSAYANGIDSVIKLEALQQMLDRHLISQKDYEKRKQKLINQIVR